MKTNLIAGLGGAGALLLVLTACGSGGGATNAAAPADNGGGATAGAAPGATTQQGRFPGADGKVAAVTGSTAQVQSQGNGQVAVTWNGSTTFTQQVGAQASDVKVGSCVSVQATDEASSSGSDAAATAVTASTVRITEKTDGPCTGGLRGGPSGQAGGGPQLNGTPPSGAPSGAPSAGAQPPSGTRPQIRGFGGAFGEVTAVSANGFTVKSQQPDFGSGGSTPTMKEVTVTVTTSGATTYTTTGKATAAAVKTGECLRAQGTVDDTGAVTATTIAMSPAVNGECGGFVRRDGSGPASGGTGSGTATQES